MVVVIGAGVAGLAAAGVLQRAGVQVQVLDKARGVGGRCATRRLEGQSVDHGVSWFHGSDPSFLAAFDGFEPTERIEGWPVRVEGKGPPCNPRGLSEVRFALRAGASAFPKHLARDLDVKLSTRVDRLDQGDATIQVHTEQGDTLEAEHVLLTLPNAQTSELLGTLQPDRQLSGVRFLLRRAAAVPCLTLAALYPLDTLDPGFDVWLPGSGPLALVSHDSTKRADPTHRALVVQATPAWSAAHLEQDPGIWSQAMLKLVAARLGPWALAPTALHTHRWRYARLDPAWAFHGPVVLGAQRAKVVLAGEAFHEGTGVQGAFLAGQRAAQRLLEIGCRTNTTTTKP